MFHRSLLLASLFAAGVAPASELTPELARCLDGFKALGRVHALAVAPHPRSPHQQEQYARRARQRIADLNETFQNTLTAARQREAALEDVLALQEFEFQEIVENFEASRNRLEEAKATQGHLPGGHPLLESYVRMRAGYSTIESLRNKTAERLLLARALRMRLQNRVGRLTYLTNQLKHTSILDPRYRELLSSLADHGGQLATILSPMEIQLIDSKGVSVEFDEVRRSRGHWILVEAKSASGFHLAQKPLRDHPETGQPFSSREEQWVYKHLIHKTARKIAALQKASTSPESFRVMGARDVTSVVPFVEEIAAIRILRFEIEEFSPELNQEVRRALSRLKHQFPDWTFEFGFGP